MLITPEYRQLNEQLHSRNVDFGSHGHEMAKTIEQAIHTLPAVRTILDYGAGKCTLAAALPHLGIRNYDPAIPGIDDAPEPADLVICSDVLEHIEPECLEDVLDDIKALALEAVFLVVATRPANKHLPDGRNVHLIQKRIAWWLPKLMYRWNVLNLVGGGGKAFIFIGEAM